MIRSVTVVLQKQITVEKYFRGVYNILEDEVNSS